MTDAPTPKAAKDEGYRYQWHRGHAPALLENIRVSGLSQTEHLKRETESGVRVEPGEEFESPEHVNHPHAVPLSPRAKAAAEEINRQFVSGAE